MPETEKDSEIDCIETESGLDDVLTRPSRESTQFIKTIASPLLILGAGGKMGPTVALMARRAADAAGHPMDVIAVSRFNDDRARTWLEGKGVKTIACDLLNPESVQTLPDAENIIYLVGTKFGTAKAPATTWAINVAVPIRVTERYPRARIVALSTGNVYPLTPVAQGGSIETDSLTPIGEYANAAVGRERIFEFCALRNNISVTLLRLFYAVEVRYGVLVDLAQKVSAGVPIELENGFLNCIWQRDANDMILRAFSLAKPQPLAWNLCRPEVFSIRAIATQLGDLLERSPKFNGKEASTALLGKPDRICAALGAPPTSLETMVRWIAHWIKHGGRTLAKPTHFEVRDGKY